MFFRKKLLAILLVVAMSLLATSVTFADAHEMTTEEKALVLYDLGLFLGTSTEEFRPNLEGATDRSAGMVMVARALNWVNAEDWNEEAVSGFVDVPEWAEAYVAYAVEMGVTVGVSETLFGNDLAVTERQLQTWFDRALGKGDALETWEANVDLDDETALNRADLVAHTWEALMEVPVDGELTLIMTILGDVQVHWAIAVDGGLVELNEVVIDPDAYEVTVDDMEKDFYLPGDMLEFTVRGLEPLTALDIGPRIQLAEAGGYPYFDNILVGQEDMTFTVLPDGTITIRGELKADLPLGNLVFTLGQYGYGIDDPLNLMRGDHSVMLDPDWVEEVEENGEVE